MQKSLDVLFEIFTQKRILLQKAALTHTLQSVSLEWCQKLEISVFIFQATVCSFGSSKHHLLFIFLSPPDNTQTPIISACTIFQSNINYSQKIYH